MAKKEFDLGAMLAGVSELNTGREQIEYIRLDLIDDDPNNFYQLSDLDKLADNISMCGLQQPIRVRKHPDQDDRYMIVSGHRRRAAVKMLAEEDPEKWQEIACIVEQEAVSPSLQQLRLIYANSNTRTLTPAELGEQAVQVEKLLYQLKEEGYEFPGRMRDHVAAAVNASASKLARLKVIREKLAFEWQASFKAGALAESTAYTLAQMPAAWQRLIFDSIGSKPNQVYDGTVKAFQTRFQQISETKCGDRCDVTCSHQSVMMKKSCKDLWSDPCWNTYCCLKCNNLQTCKNSCSHAAGRKKELKDIAKEASLRAEEDRIKREQLIIDFIRDVYSRVGDAREFGCVSVEKLYAAARMIYSASVDGPKQQALEDGTAKFTVNTPLPFGYSAYASTFMKLCAVADSLNCSIDYLLGRSEDLRPAGGWQTGNPWNLGQYAVMVRWSKDCKVSVEKMEWDGESWRQFGDVIEIFGCPEIFGWIELPEEVQENG